MNLQFCKVSTVDTEKINEAYQIIKACGEYMYNEQGLLHWRTPYPVESIREDCLTRHVYLAKDLDSNVYVHTFQLEIGQTGNDSLEKSVAKIYKFATMPWASGKGVGKDSMSFIEAICQKEGVSVLSLDVYDQSELAICFFKKRSFCIVDSRPTKYFRVYIMEKEL